jgi:hypothetical protein
MTKAKKKNRFRDDWASELRELDERIENLQSQRKEIVEKIEKWRASCAEDAAKPEEIDPLFCDRSEPCEQTVTLIDNGIQHRNQVRALEEQEIDTLFCSSRTKECETIPWKFTDKGILPGEPLVLDKDRSYVWLVEKPKTEAYVENKISHYARIRKYLSEQWQQVKTSFRM